MQRRHAVKETLEWIVYDATGTPIAAFAHSFDASEFTPEDGFYKHHDYPVTTEESSPTAQPPEREPAPAPE